jgi:hypothetical protein
VRTFTGIAMAVALLLAPSTAAAQLPTGEADGVRVVREHRAIVVVFTKRAAKLYKRIAGKLVYVSCTEETADGSNGGGPTLRAPRHGHKLYTGDLTRGMDYCRIWLVAHTVKRHGERVRVAKQLIVSIPLTQKGAVFLDEESKTIDMLEVEVVAGIVQEQQKLPGLPTYAQLVQEFPKIAKTVVQLAAPGDSPPPGKVGYYSDGQEHIATVIISASGRRLFIEAAADDVLTTNVAQYLFSEPQ